MTTYTHEGRFYGLGRHVEPQHDPRNRDFPAATAGLHAVDWTRFGGPLDQGQVGSCTGNALAGWFNTAPGSDGTHLRTEADALRYYSQATAIDPYLGTYPPTDTGSDGPSVCKAARADGELTGYQHAFGLDHFLGALMLSPLIVGTVWLKRMFTPDANGLLKVSGAVAGGHEYEAVSYDPATKLIGFWNSWGTSWGKGGRFFIHPADFGHLLAQHGDVTVPQR